VVEASVKDQVLDAEERKDILWLCERLQSTQYFDAVTADLQVLHAILGGIAADGHVSKEELTGLREWVDCHVHLRTLWPFDEVDSLITAVLRDGKIDDDEQRVLHAFFGEFLAILDDRTITDPIVILDKSSLGVCAMCPEIVFEGSTFCFTGASNQLTRADFHLIVEGLGGIASRTVNASVKYLVIGAEGNPCWAYSCYGRKVEAAIEYRKRGYPLMIVHENDFNDAVLDHA
jgi:NAD-dependent DNA ligase